ncbi:uncharacterized protein VICG_00357 [Vittaforma corneae ATCC 50505]|uniref:Uncharacterized protein n=1 Tax=Vittaforma corneae (strain ATCC 50505) TaxID=993615 RepID=L2GQ53_VITCO|nr:uncharacterized protein VICG_00357 [Vittaforma corneae ATCC 50505]ELA42605.1 hypothetical protein VICG_00357 [Vittaforma corneae ATCC 50505]
MLRAIHCIIGLFAGLTLETAPPGRNADVPKMGVVGMFSDEKLKFSVCKKYIENINYLSEIVDSFEANKANKTISDALAFLIKVTEDNIQEYYIDSKEEELRELNGFGNIYRKFTTMSEPKNIPKSSAHFYEKGKANSQKEKFVHSLDIFMKDILKYHSSGNNKNFECFLRKVCLRFLGELSARFKTTVDFSLYIKNFKSIKKMITTVSTCLEHLVDLLNRNAIHSNTARSSFSALVKASKDIDAYFEELIQNENGKAEFSYGLTVSYFALSSWIDMLALLSQSTIDAKCEKVIDYKDFMLLIFNTVIFNTVENADIKQYLSCRDVLDNLINGTIKYYILNKLWAVVVREPKKTVRVDAKKLGGELHEQPFEVTEEENKPNVENVVRFDENQIKFITKYTQCLKEILQDTKGIHNLPIFGFVRRVDISKINLIFKKNVTTDEDTSPIKTLQIIAVIEVIINLILIITFIVL